MFHEASLEQLGALSGGIKEEDTSLKALHVLRVRSIVTLCVFGCANGIALKFPVIGFVLSATCLIIYLRAAPA